MYMENGQLAWRNTCEYLRTVKVKFVSNSAATDASVFGKIHLMSSHGSSLMEQVFLYESPEKQLQKLKMLSKTLQIGITIGQLTWRNTCGILAEYLRNTPFLFQVPCKRVLARCHINIDINVCTPPSSPPLPPFDRIPLLYIPIYLYPPSPCPFRFQIVPPPPPLPPHLSHLSHTSNLSHP